MTLIILIFRIIEDCRRIIAVEYEHAMESAQEHLGCLDILQCPKWGVGKGCTVLRNCERMCKHQGARDARFNSTLFTLALGNLHRFSKPWGPYIKKVRK